MTTEELYEQGQTVAGNIWTPKREWNDQDAFIIGGGASLRDFNFEWLKGKNTIGCNDAFRLGPDIVKICLFGDASYFYTRVHDLEKFPGLRVTNCAQLANMPIPWLLRMVRRDRGLGEGNVLGWNYSTGAAAVNLALTLGATQIFLLGFDMARAPDGQSHWHSGYGNRRTRDDQIERFLEGFKEVADGLQAYPDVTVWNYSPDGSSALPYFSQINLQDMKELSRCH